MKNSYLKIAVVAVALMLPAGAALAQDATPPPPPPHAHGPRGGGFGAPMFGLFGHQLDLTDAQKTQIKAIMSKERPTLKPLLQQVGQGQAQLRQLELGSTFDEGQARTIATQQSQSVTELAVQRARVEAELIQVLTPDQRTKLAQLWQSRQQHMTSHSQEAPTAQ
jgi:protein CpxP